jgi:hypothetical protein
MTADIINLRRARKAKAKAGQEAVAAENRVKFGRTKAEREQASAETALQDRRLEGHRREAAQPGGGPPEPAGGEAGKT